MHRYRLEGFDGGWVEAGPRRVAYYTNLAPGRYRLPGAGQQRRRRVERGGRRARAAPAPRTSTRPAGSTRSWAWRVAGARRSASTGCAWRGCAGSTWRCSPSAAASRASCTTRSCRGCRAWRCSCAGVRRRLLARAPSRGRARWRRSRTRSRRSLEETRRFVWNLREQAGGERRPGAARSRRLAGRLAEGRDRRVPGERRGEAGPAAARSVQGDLFRIAQEAIANALKHAEAASSTCGCATAAATVTLSISDDGRGFDPEARRRRGRGPLRPGRDPRAGARLGG